MKTSTTFLLVLAFFSWNHSILTAQAWEDKAIGQLPVNYGVYGIDVVNENIIWAVAFDQTISPPVPADHITKILKTTDGGATWEVFDLEEAMGRVSYNITAFNENTAFINAQDFLSGAGRGVWKTEDGGETWVENFANPAGGVWVRFFNEQEAVVINRHRIATTENGGNSWEVIPEEEIPAFREGEFTILSSGNNSCEVVGDHVWFGTSMGRVYRSRNKGKNWEVFDTGLGEEALLLSVAFADTLNGIVAEVAGASTIFARTRDGGENWETVVPDSAVYIANIVYVPGTDSMIVGTSDNFYPVDLLMSAYSMDFGKTWQLINDSVAFGGTEFLSPQIGWSSNGLITAEGQPAMFQWAGDLSVGVRQMVVFDQYYKVSPNPFSQAFVLENQLEKPASYRIFNSNGQLMKTGIISSSRLVINTQELSAGIYYLEIRTEGTAATKRLIKMR